MSEVASLAAHLRTSSDPRHHEAADMMEDMLAAVDALMDDMGASESIAFEAFSAGFSCGEKAAIRRVRLESRKQ